MSDVPTPATDVLGRDRRLAWTLLALVGALFVGYSAMSLGRVTNVHFGDVEFTGWSGPMGSRLLKGDRPYVDFVLPIPPGSFVVLALIEKLVGRPLLLEELWLNAAIHLCMGLLAYRIARAFTTRKNAVLTSVATLATVVQLNKECAYDHTAQLVAWASIASGISALTSSDGAKSRRLWMLTGALASFTLAFKQSTGMGAIFGWLAAIGYLSAVELWSNDRVRARAWLLPLSRYAQGIWVGLGGLWLMLLLLGSTARAFFQAVFTDASILKGGTKFLLKNLTVYLFEFPAYPGSLLVIAVWVLIGVRLTSKRGGIHSGDEMGRVSPLDTLRTGIIGFASAAAFGSAIWFLRRPPYPISWVLEIDKLKAVPPLGLVPATALFVAHLVRTETRGSGELRTDPVRAGHVLNASMIAAFACSLMHNTSAPEFRPFYDNNVLIPLTFMMTFMVLDRAKLEWAGAIFFALSLGSLFGNKYYRTMRATTKMDSATHWAHMRASAGGVEIARAAERARELTMPTEAVLVLPEDVALAALVGRPRPGLLGAIVFVDQYAPRLAADDIARLDEKLPKVIIIHPRRVTSWQRFFRIWSGQSGAEALIQHVLSDLLPKRYKKDSSFGTTFMFESSALDLYVLKRPGEVEENEDEPADPDAEDSPPPRGSPTGEHGEHAGVTGPARTNEPRALALKLLGVAVVLHVVLLRYFTPKGLLFSGTPIFEYDYALHGYQADRAVSAFRATGHLWSYDPFVLAGQPANVFEDATNKMLELFVVAATRAGASTWVAFNSYVLLLHASVPVIAWWAARLFGMSRVASSLTALFWVVLWYFDSFLHWCWFVGMVAWGAGSAIIVLVVALMYRATRDGRPVHYASLVGAAAFITLLHPFAVVTLVPPLAVLYARSFRTLQRREHAFLLAGVGLAAATTLVWLGPALLFRRSMGDVDAFLWPPPRYAILDWLDLLEDVLMTGQPVRTAFRTLVLTLSVAGLVRLRNEKDDRFLPLATLVVGSFALAYLSGYSTVLRQTQPYRNVGPAALGAAVVAAMELPVLLGRAADARLSRDGKAVLLLAAVLAAPALFRTVAGYLPTLIPDRTLPRSALRPGPLPGVSNDEYAPMVLGHFGPTPEYVAIGRHLDASLGQRGRAVVFDWVLGEYLATFSGVPVVGGIPQRNVPQVAAHPLRHDFTVSSPGDDPFRRYLDEYAVGAVVMTGEHGPVDDRLDLLELDRVFGDHRVYRVRTEPSYFARGSGRITRQAQNLVSVADAVGPEVVLKFHFVHTLRCRPDCTVERAGAERDPAGFIRIANPPPAFDIENAYRVVR